MAPLREGLIARRCLKTPNPLLSLLFPSRVHPISGVQMIMAFSPNAGLSPQRPRITSLVSSPATIEGPYIPNLSAAATILMLLARTAKESGRF